VVPLGATWVVLALGAAWVLGVLTARHGGQSLNVAFCVVNACFGLAVLVRCMFDFRLRSLCADLPVDDVHDEHRRRRGSQDTWCVVPGLVRGGSRDTWSRHASLCWVPGTPWTHVVGGPWTRAWWVRGHVVT